MELHFECTMCGQCCHDLKLPLTVPEAVQWLNDGRTVQVLCEAMPWASEPAASDALAQHRRRRSFEARSGELPVRVVVVLAASFTGACPNLDGAQRCGIYERRPMVCRIYPAEIRPGLEVLPAHKACPPEAWAQERPIFVRRHQVVDPDLRALIQRSRDHDVRDVPVKEQLCAALGLQCAALVDEGWAIHAPAPADLLRELLHAGAAPAGPVGRGQWQLLSNRQTTVDGLAQLRALGATTRDLAQRGVEYRGFHPDAL
jgi:Fe-S-cluster containining protein